MTPSFLRASPLGVLLSARAMSRCSVETYSSLRLSASRSACLRTPSRREEIWVGAPCWWGRLERALSTAWLTAPRFAPIFPRAEGTTPPSWERSDARRCSVLTSGWSAFSAAVWAEVKASWAFTVNWSNRMRTTSVSRMYAVSASLSSCLSPKMTYLAAVATWPVRLLQPACRPLSDSSDGPGCVNPRPTAREARDECNTPE